MSYPSTDLDFSATSSSSHFSSMLGFWWSTFCPSYFLWPEVSVKCGTTKMLSLHSSAASCKARATVQHLVGEKLEVIPHPPNSPDLAPCDLLFFFNVENRPCWQDIFVNARPSKSCEFTTFTDKKKPLQTRFKRVSSVSRVRHWHLCYCSASMIYNYLL